MAVLADSGHDVVGVDRRTDLVEALNEGRTPHFEPGLAELLEKVRDRVRATTDTTAAVAETDATFVIVPTPTGPDGTFVLDYVLPAMEEIGAGMAKGSGSKNGHLVVLTSTVMPGATGGAVRRALEESSGLQAGKDFGLCYNPEFVALGAVIQGLRGPDFLLIGEDEEAPVHGDRLVEIYEGVCPGRPAARMAFANAELAKLAVNTFVTTKISFANLLAQLCSRLPGGNVDQVTDALGLDARIGKKYLRGALGYGGPCFPRDNLALVELAHSLGADPQLPQATDAFNRGLVGELVRMVEERLPANGTTAVLGLSYKPDTDVSEESQGLALVEALIQQGHAVRAYDPAARPELPAAAERSADLQGAVDGADVVVITTPWPEFGGLRQELPTGAGPITIIDGWRMLDPNDFEGIAEVQAPGRGRR